MQSTSGLMVTHYAVVFNNGFERKTINLRWISNCTVVVVLPWQSFTKIDNNVQNITGTQSRHCSIIFHWCGYLYGTKWMNFAWFANNLIKLSGNVAMSTSKCVRISVFKGTVSGFAAVVLWWLTVDCMALETWLQVLCEVGCPLLAEWSCNELFIFTVSS